MLFRSRMKRWRTRRWRRLIFPPSARIIQCRVLTRVKSLGYAQAPVVMVGADHWSDFRPDKIKAAALAVEAIAI